MEPHCGNPVTEKKKVNENDGTQVDTCMYARSPESYNGFTKFQLCFAISVKSPQKLITDLGEINSQGIN